MKKPRRLSAVVWIGVLLFIVGLIPRARGSTFATTERAFLIESNAILRGVVTPNGEETIAWFEWGMDTNYGNVTVSVDVGAGSEVVWVTNQLAGLTPETLYHFRVVASNSTAVVFGADQRFAWSRTIVAWGHSTFAGIQPYGWGPGWLSNIVQVVGGHSCAAALTSDAQVVAWGNTNYLPVPSNLGSVVEIAGGGYNVIALRADGTVTAWGRATTGETNVPAGLSNVVGIAASDYAGFALRSDGSVVGWGNTASGQFGFVSTLSNIVSIAAGTGHALALKDDGTVVAWGFSGNGQTNVPASLTNVVGIAGGGFESLTVRSDKTIVMWGLNAAPPANVTNVVSISGGQMHYLALTDSDQVLAWGYDYDGSTEVPAGLTNVVAVVAGDYFSMALVALGDVPAAVTLPVTSITSTTAVLNAMVSANILPTFPIFEFGMTTNTYVLLNGTTIPSGSGLVHISKLITGLTPATTYSWRILTINAQDEMNGEDVLFTTSNPPIQLHASFSGDAVTLSFSGMPATTYSIYIGSSVAGPWERLGPAVEISSGAFQFTDQLQPNAPTRFYRVSVP